jgi:REP element-mobilizing transposase RayT
LAVPYDPARHHRRSIRLAGFDYASPGWYFVTLCVHRRLPLFGEVESDTVRLTDAGRMVADWWHRLPTRFPAVRLDTFVVMPNHVHGIIGIVDAPAVHLTDAVHPTGTVHPTVGADPRVRPPSGRGTMPDQGAHAGAPLPQIVQWWKTMTTNAYIHGVRDAGWVPFDGRLWQRNYWERVVRSERELDLARRYIADNPLRWHLDRMNPAGVHRPG